MLGSALELKSTCYFLDPYIQLSFVTRSATSKTVSKKLNPAWDQMLVLESVPIYGHYEQIVENPPDVVLELFDYDPVVRSLVLFKVHERISLFLV